MPQCGAKSEKDNRIYLELHGGLNRFSMAFDYIRGCHCRRRLECMIVSQEEHPEMKCA